VAASVSWLPLGVTGLSPVTVNAVPTSLGGAGAVGVAEAVGLAETVGVAETVVLIAGGPVGVGVAEHATGSAATAHRAATAAAVRTMLVI
jgi:hypothetical protein